MRFCLYYNTGWRVVPLTQSGLRLEEQFAFYDQVHTTGMDIKHQTQCTAALTLNTFNTFRDYAQASYRMRGIGNGQTIELLIIPEVYKRINEHLNIKMSMNVKKDISKILNNIITWLILNQMKSENTQRRLLSEQCLMNVWRKSMFLRLTLNITATQEMPDAEALDLFRGRVDYTIDNKLKGKDGKYSKAKERASRNGAL